MAKKLQKPQAVIDAEALVLAKGKALESLEAAVLQAEEDLATATEALSKARIDADAHLPQCNVVRVSRYTGKKTIAYRAVIERQTPTGMIVVRPVGIEPLGDMNKYKWDGLMKRFSQQWLDCFTSELMILEDVPKKYMPA